MILVLRAYFKKDLLLAESFIGGLKKNL